MGQTKQGTGGLHLELDRRDTVSCRVDAIVNAASSSLLGAARFGGVVTFIKLTTE